MSSLRYLIPSDLVAYRICETASAIRLVPGVSLRSRIWDDEEVARIRAVFQKLVSLRVQNDHDAEDLVQEALLTMVAKCPKDSLEKGLLVWGMAVLRKKVGNYYRKTRRFVPFEDGAGEAGLSQNAGWVTTSAESRVHLTELQSLIQSILEGFAPQQREILKLHLAGHATREIARQMRPERYQNVVNHLYRGRKRLARELRRYGY